MGSFYVSLAAVALGIGLLGVLVIQTAMKKSEAEPVRDEKREEAKR
jgi:hypothetical protein